MELGKINTLKVLRESDIAYVLTDGLVEVFLHKKEAKKPYLDGEDIDVFLYSDNQGRVTASTKEPLIQLNEVKMLEVVSVNERYGAFLYYGMVKDLLLSLDDLPNDSRDWPKPGDFVMVEMINKKDHLYGHIIGRKQITDHFPDAYKIADNETVEANVMYLIDNGLVCFTKDGHEIFIHKNNYRERYHIGQLVKPKILKQNPSDEYVGTLIEQKEIMLEKDALRILDYLERNNGIMKYTDKSNAEEIQQVFHMSKSAFKRALGSLYRAKKVILNKENTKKI
ncbi:S1-like domain-containing RNA-binding protein [Candidatus Izemoplasma sp. B36]|uniref:S1-like domain-containing RNA-binding protein n=1 Tax=Candidatus Izemoplasma sp. B36 TaxID=3242468 RepID=UPI0035572934